MTFINKPRERTVPRTFTAHVVDELRQLILSGVLVEGQQLRQDTLAATLNVSRIPVREGLRQLEAEGLVTFFPHRGAIVSELSLDEISELFDGRALLECDMLRRAIPKFTAADLDAAEEVLDFYDDAFAQKDVSVWGQFNWKFHSTLYARAGRPRTFAMIETLNNNVDRYLRLHLQLPSAVREAQEAHRKLLALCRERQSDAASAFLREHILTAGDALIAFVREHRNARAGSG
ncbi:MAG: GntR family transcriptional regulator [Alphaproteobacteria bacterium]|nr:GntR family transcriptional regulator [Alphaproteobacteria bacterium]